MNDLTKRHKTKLICISGLIITAMAVSGCLTLSTTPQTKDVLIRSLATAVAAEVIRHDPDIKPLAEGFCRAFLAMTDPTEMQRAMDVGFTYLKQKYADRAATIELVENLMATVTIDIRTDDSDLKIQTMTIIARGFLAGLVTPLSTEGRS